METLEKKGKGSALLPFLLFIVIYLGAGLYFQAQGVEMAFYQFPSVTAMFIALLLAFCQGKGTIDQKFTVFAKGAANENVLTMLMIYILAGAFSTVASAMGGVDATVNLGLSVIPVHFLAAGVFVISAFMGTATGTSMGTISAIVPIAVGVAEKGGLSLPLFLGACVGGAMFGDNLSFISDTTVVATQTQECRMSDKFRINSLIVVPAAIIILIVYAIMGAETKAPTQVAEVEYIKVIPYLLVLVTAIAGMNVMAVLTMGTLLCGAIGIIENLMGIPNSYDFFGWFSAMGNGVISMGELVIIAMMAGGILETIRENGGINFIISKITAPVKNKRGAELSIAALVSFVNLCTANNTVAILTVGNISKKIGDKFGVDNRKAASILDTFSCCVQGLIPYGVQMLLAAGLAHISPIDILPYLYYPMAIGVAALMAILFRYPRHYS